MFLRVAVHIERHEQTEHTLQGIPVKACSAMTICDRIVSEKPATIRSVPIDACIGNALEETFVELAAATGKPHGAPTRLNRVRHMCLGSFAWEIGTAPRFAYSAPK
ncbi:hypothetical protein [Ralstonia solanacearum]|uniref:hypothetical protein n=1 Tax=Ralstonia solanacearum TaxID=305 RepID=UPI0005AC93E7|nr:hypothetical protein [Ralstonia solanacearum]MDC6210567.1 hypothetical protein [Ralstonia solanacearum]MDC6240043.1 hypothetical protein [Ralstonia solanacearum]MDD7800431.1 hypothetical protein [Ralstonia solanacearum]